MGKLQDLLGLLAIWILDFWLESQGFQFWQINILGSNIPVVTGKTLPNSSWSITIHRAVPKLWRQASPESHSVWEKPESRAHCWNHKGSSIVHSNWTVGDLGEAWRPRWQLRTTRDSCLWQGNHTFMTFISRNLFRPKKKSPCASSRRRGKLPF